MTTNRQVCPVCAQSVFVFRGPQNAKFLIIVDEPSSDDFTQMKALSGGVGWVLRNELDRASQDMYSYRIGYMYWHEMKTGKESELCKAASIENAISESHNRQAILLLGASTVKYFTGQSVDIVSSLRVKSQFLKCDYIMAGIGPNVALAGVVGELRLTCQRWNEMLEEIDKFRSDAFNLAYEIEK